HSVGLAFNQGRIGRRAIPRRKKWPARAVRATTFHTAEPIGQTRYFSMFSPASCLLLSQLAIRPRPDQVSFVLGSRNLAFTLPLRPFRAGAPLPLLAFMGGRPLLFGAP